MAKPKRTRKSKAPSLPVSEAYKHPTAATRERQGMLLAALLAVLSSASHLGGDPEELRSLLAMLKNLGVDWKKVYLDAVKIYEASYPRNPKAPSLDEVSPESAAPPVSKVSPGTSNVYYGIDLGTGNCSVAWVAEGPRARREPPIPIEVEKFQRNADTQSVRFPSVVAVPSRLRTLVKALFGWRASTTRGRGPFERGCNLFYSVKSDMGTSTIYDEAQVLALATPVDVTSALLDHLIRSMIERSLPDPRDSQVVITVPASFAGNQRADTLAAARQAGLHVDEGDLLDEPVAALLDLCNSPDLDAKIRPVERTNLLILDFGAGTCDVALLRVQYAEPDQPLGLKIETLGIGPYEKFGGDNLDWAILERVVWPQVCERHGLDKDQLLERLKRRFADANIWRVARTLKENMCIRVAEASRRKGRSHAASKIMVDARTEAVKFDDMRIPATQIKMTREDFEEAIAPFIAANPGEQKALFADDFVEASLLRPVQEVLDSAKMTPGDVHYVILNGGSCRNPYVRQCFEEWGFFAPSQILETPDLDASVARGAALHCFWYHARQQMLVAPIASEEIGVLTQEDACIALVPSGSLLPWPPPGQPAPTADGLVVPRSGLDELAIPLYTGSESRRRLVHIGSVPLHGSVPAGTPVQVSVAVDANRICHWRFRVLAPSPIESELPVANPWVNRVTTPHEREVERVSTQIAETFSQTRKVPLGMKIWLADALRRAGETFRAKEIVERVLERDPDNAGAHNMMGLLWGALRQDQRALDQYARAADLAPQEPIYLGNQGAGLVNLGRHAEGIATLRSALETNPNLSYCHSWLGQAYEALGDMPRAEEEFRRSIQVLSRHVAEADHPRAEDYRELARLQRRIGDYQEAEKCDQTAYALQRREWLGVDPSAIISSFDVTKLLEEMPPCPSDPEEE